MKNEAKLTRAQLEASSGRKNQQVGRAPQRRASLIEQFNASFNRKLRSAFSAVDWGQVNHYMDKWS